MISNPQRYIEPFIVAGADGITFHIEATDEVETCIQLIKRCGKKVGIAINPDTPTEKILPYIDMIDMALLMTVFPGYGGQKYIETVNAKIMELREKVGERLFIEVDGGVNAETAREAKQAGANILVAGTAIFEKDIAQAVKDLLQK